MFLDHPLLKPDAVEDRAYQAALAARLIERPHLLVLPTGLGKTVVALRALLHFLEHEPEKRVLLLAPTKPLADQHARYLGETLQGITVACFTGETPPQERDAAWPGHRVIVATPQVVQNDLVRGVRDLSDVSFLIFDEAHRATGQYPYAFLARRYRAAGGRHLAGLTASPGNSSATVHRVLANLGLEAIEIRTESDPDVAPYLHKVETQWIRVRPTPTLLNLVRLLERCYARCVLALRRLGHFQLLRGLPTRKDLIDLGAKLRAAAAEPRAGRGLFQAVSLQARALKIQHALELAETQGTPLLYRFLQRIEQEATSAGGSKAARDIVREPEFLEVLARARDDADTPPKIAKILELVQAELARGARRILVFANYRETAEDLVGRLTGQAGVRASRFVGHARVQGEKGMTKRDQQGIVQRFRSGDLNVLVATAVGEEGLDLPETDAVIFHEAVASAIRLIQRRGRTGRHADGSVYVLLTEGTRDESYQWSAVRRERRMQLELGHLRKIAPTLQTSLAPPPPNSSVPTLPGTSRADGLEIVMDVRESTSAVARSLVERGLRIKTVTLPTGDYSVSERLLVERKTAEDFAASLKDGRLFEQLPRLARAGLGLLVVEGDLFGAPSGISRAALAGALATAVADHRITVLCVPDAHATADLLAGLARRERRDGRPTALRVLKTPLHPESQILFVVEGIPGVGPVLGRRLLEHFDSVAALSAASVEELEAVPGVGPETARTIHEVLHRPYLGGHAAPLAGKLEVAVAAVEGGEAPAR